MTDGQTSAPPPQLTTEGAQLLADVLARRVDAQRHDTVRARAGAHRRDNDPLRQEPRDVLGIDDFEPDEPLGPRPIRHTSPHDSTNANALVAAVGIAVVLFGGVIIGLISTQASTADGAGPDTQVLGSVQVAEPSEVELLIATVDPLRDGVRSFMVELQNVRRDEPIATADITISVEDNEGIPAVTIVRFGRPDVPIGESATTAVRVESATADHVHVVVRLDGVEVDRAVLDG